MSDKIVTNSKEIKNIDSHYCQMNLRMLTCMDGGMSQALGINNARILLLVLQPQKTSRINNVITFKVYLVLQQIKRDSFDQYLMFIY